MTVDLHALTPAQRRVYRELLAIGEPRPSEDPHLAEDVRAFLHEQLEPAVALRPAGARGLRLNKTALDALDCDGRYLDHIDSSFEWSSATVLGTLVHRAVELDQAGRRDADVYAVVAQAWRDFCDRGEHAAEYLTTLGGVEADALRADATARVIEFRESFPLLPAHCTVRAEPSLRVPLHKGAVELLGKPDILFGGAHATERRLLLVDLKTGRRSTKDRADMRFYALLCTLKYRTAPFRVATYYLDEAEWDAEDVSAETLEAAARTVAVKARSAATLTWSRPRDADLRLLAGPACRWCARALDCPAKAAADAEYAARG